jgi:uncharacterized protein YeaO (DUF488 family)
MLRQASVSDLITDRVNRDKGYVVITMRRYPRFIRRELRDEYVSTMSPDVKLHEEWLAAKRRNHDHDGAFARTHYERRFEVSDPGWADLARLCRLAKRKTVYFVCQCPVGYRCHREMLLILAREIYGAPAEDPRNDYPEFRKRIPGFKRRLAAGSRRAVKKPGTLKRRRAPAAKTPKTRGLTQKVPNSS